MAYNAGAVIAELKAKTTNFVKGMKTASSSVMDFEKESKSLKSLMTSGLGFIGVVGSVAALRSEFNKSIEAASEYESAMMGLTSVSNAFGVSQDEANEAAQRLSEDGLLSFKGAAEGLKNLLPRFNGDLDASVQVMEVFKDAAAFNRQGTLSFEEAIVGATGGLKNLNSIMVDNVGISKNISVILKENGFTMQDLDDATKSEAATQALLNGIMQEGELFMGDAERAANTYQGRLAQLETATFNLRRELGAQLLPVLQTFIADGVNAANSATTAASGTENFGKAVYVVGNLIKGFVLAIKTGVTSITAVGQAFVAVGKTVYNFAVNVQQNLGSVTEVIRVFGQAAKAALTGDFERAGNIIKGAFGKPLQKAINQSAVELYTFQNLSNQAVSDFNAAKAAFKSAFTLEGFQSLSGEAFSLGEQIERTGGATSDFGKKGKSAAESVEEALKETEDQVIEVDDITRVLTDTLDDLREKASDAFATFKQRRKDVKESLASMKKGLKALRKEIKGIKSDSKEAIATLKDDFAEGIADITSDLGANIGKEVVNLEESIAASKDSILGIEKDQADDVLGIQEKFASDSAALEQQRVDDIASIRDSLDVTDLEEEAAEEIAKIRNSINDFATAAEEAEAEARIAAIQAERDEKITAREQEVEDAIALVEQQTADELAELTTAKDSAISLANTEAQEKVAILQAQVDEEQAILDKHQSTFAQFASAITEQRRLASQDNIALLLEQFATEQTAREQKLEEDIAAEKQARKDAIKSAKKGFAQEFDVRLKNLDNLKQFWKKKEKSFERHLKRIRKKQKNAIAAIEEDFLTALGTINNRSGGALGETTGGVSLDVERGSGGSAVLNIGDITVNGDADVNQLIDRLTNLLEASTA